MVALVYLAIGSLLLVPVVFMLSVLYVSWCNATKAV